MRVEECNTKKTCTGRNNTIQGLRGLACTMVFLSHALGMIPEEIKSGIFFNWQPLHFFYDGKIAVGIFWILSGYYIQKSISVFSIKKYGTYLVKRFSRLYPLYFASLCTGTLFCNMGLEFDIQYFSQWIAKFWNQPVNVKCFVEQMLLRGDFNTINPPVWTMKYEFNMVIFLPIIIGMTAVIFRQTKSLFYIVASIIIGGGYSVTFPIIEITVLPYYFFGVLIFVNEAWIKKYIKGKKQIMICCISIFLMDLNNIFPGALGGSVMEYIAVIGSCLCIVICIHGDFLDKLLRCPVFVRLGDVSYEFYLFHFIVLLVMRSFIPQIDNWVISIIGAFVISCFIAYILYRINVPYIIGRLR
ncbi:MAG: acyltransferase [Lachnospiraceae bacterium]|nr:acyltransferase [Lachnospiraceae bacterium]